MSRRSSHEHEPLADSGEVLEIIREEQGSPSPSSLNINDNKEDGGSPESSNCPCQAAIDAEAEKRHAEEKERLLTEKELEMEKNFKERLDTEVEYLKDRFGFILQNEQIRASCMLREAHRERQEKISALQTQLECKNLAGLMYVLCSERRKNKMEKLRLIEEYSNYIHALQNILEDSQDLILNLSRGYKTAARVDREWREKMKKIMQHFQSFVYDFMGGGPETNQYFFDIPKLLKTEAPTKDNPQEDPCEDEEELDELFQPEKSWYETLEGEDRPFVMFGDMADLKPSQRGEVLRSIKAAKTAPRKWKEYVFRDMYLKQSCPNLDSIKDEWESHGRWEISATDRQNFSRCSDIPSRRVTTASMDIRGNMGSILKIITSSGTPHTGTKTTLLGARDSMEIASTTRLREKQRPSGEHAKVVLNIGNKIDSMFNEIQAEHEESTPVEPEPGPKEPRPSLEEDEDIEESQSNLGSIHHDSLQVIQSHVPDHDTKINYEKICPMEKCQRMQVDSFIRSLPAYMRASPFTHFEQTYDEYEACSPEQLEILKSRLEEKRRREKVEFLTVDDPLRSWSPSAEGVAVAKDPGGGRVGEDLEVGEGVAGVAGSLTPPCTCPAPGPSLASSTMKVYTVADLIPIKQELDKINAECFFHDGIEFDRFKVLGQDESDNNLKYEKGKDFSNKRLQDIKKILKQHPSLYEIFQANTRC